MLQRGRYNASVSSLPPALVVDTREWFLDEAWRAHVAPRHWRRLPPRADVALQRAVKVLTSSGARATFLIPAALATRAAGLLADVVAAGHEVALSVRSPQPLDEVPEAERARFVDAWREERAALEAAIGRGIHGFAAVWPIQEPAALPWWRAALREVGFAYDATPIAGREQEVVALDGKTGRARRFAAWRLDDEQPRLMGLPRDVREAHERQLQGAAAELAALAAAADAPVADRLGLGVAPVRPLPPVPAPVSMPPPPPSGGPRLAVVVPLKDEAEGVPSLFVELELLSRALADVAACEFVMVDDGSVDETWPLLERLARNRRGFRLVRHDVNRGVAAAIRSGMQATDAELVASIDGDLSYDPMELRHMVPMIADADVVTSSPYHPDGGVKNVPEWRLFLSRTLSRCYRVLLGSRLRTWTSCFRVYRRNAVLHLPLHNPGFLGTAELAVRVLRRGGTVAEHPCTLEARLLGFSKMRVLRVVLGHLRLLSLVALRVVR